MILVTWTPCWGNSDSGSAQGHTAGNVGFTKITKHNVLLSQRNVFRPPQWACADLPGRQPVQRPVQPDLECGEPRGHHLLPAHLQEVDGEWGVGLYNEFIKYFCGHNFVNNWNKWQALISWQNKWRNNRHSVTACSFHDKFFWKLLPPLCPLY